MVNITILPRNDEWPVTIFFCNQNIIMVKPDYSLLIAVFVSTRCKIESVKGWTSRASAELLRLDLSARDYILNYIRFFVNKTTNKQQQKITVEPRGQRVYWVGFFFVAVVSFRGNSGHPRCFRDAG